MTRFVLLRHAYHDAVGKYLSGLAPGLHLNAAGRQQVERLVDVLHDTKFAAIVTSPLERTRETAEPIARDHGLELAIDERFIEYGIGDWTGRTFASLNPTTEWKRFNDLRSLARAPGGELILQVQQRAVARLLDWHERYPDGVVAIVSHGDVVRAVLLYLLGMPVDFLHRLEISPAGVSVFDLDGDAIRVKQVNGDTVPRVG